MKNFLDDTLEYFSKALDDENGHYFCKGCENFEAMIEDPDEHCTLRNAVREELDCPEEFVLTYCSHKKNKYDHEGNAGEEFCPIKN